MTASSSAKNRRPPAAQRPPLQLRDHLCSSATTSQLSDHLCSSETTSAAQRPPLRSGVNPAADRLQECRLSRINERYKDDNLNGHCVAYDNYIAMTLRYYLDEGLYFQIIFKYFLFAYSDVYIQARHVGQAVPLRLRQAGRNS